MCLVKPLSQRFAFRSWLIFQLIAGLDYRCRTGKGQHIDLSQIEVGIQYLAPALTPCQGNLVAVDIDVSPFDNSKTKREGISWTYKKFDGNDPIFGYVGEEGYLASLELRPGSDHSQKGTGAFLRRTLRYAHLMSEETFLVRMDSGNDSVGNIKVCREEKAHYIIERNLCRETPEKWLEIAREGGELQEPRPGKQV